MDPATCVGCVGGEVRYQVGEVRFVSINKEPEIPPLPSALQKQVDEYLEKEREEKEEEAHKNIKKEKEIYKNIKKEEKTYIKKEYGSPYKKPSIATELIEGHEDGDDHFHGTRNWEETFVKTQEERQNDSPWLYPKSDADIFNDESDARRVETDIEDAADDSEYDPAEDEHEQDDVDSKEEITWAGEHEDVPAQDFVVVIPGQGHDAEDHNDHDAEDHHDHDDHPEPYQHQDDLKKLMPVVTARLTMNNNSHKSNQLIPVDYDDIGHQKRLIKDKV